MAKSTLDDRAWRRLKAKIKKADGAHVKVGILQSRGGGATHDAESGLTMVELAAIHEFGSPKAGVPERSFIRSTFAEGEREVGKFTARLAKQFVEGKISLHRALDVLGQKGVAMVRTKVTRGTGVPPPNAASTVERKGSSRPLIDTGRMLGALAHEVEGAGETGRGGYRK